MFTSTVVGNEVVPDPFGLGFRVLYEVVFTDGTWTHEYLKAGRFVTGPDGVRTQLTIANANQDARISVASDDSLEKICADHERGFQAYVDAIAAGPKYGKAAAVDTSRFKPPTVDPAQAAWQKAAQQKQAVDAMVAQGVIASDDPLVQTVTDNVKALFDPAFVGLSADALAQTAAAVSSKSVKVQPAPAEVIAPGA